MRDRGSLLLGQSTGEAKIASTDHIRVSADEKRRFIRNPVPLQIQVVADEDAFSAHVIDISAGGARLVCALVPRIGAAIELDIAEFGRVAGKVVRRRIFFRRACSRRGKTVGQLQLRLRVNIECNSACTVADSGNRG